MSESSNVPPAGKPAGQTAGKPAAKPAAGGDVLAAARAAATAYAAKAGGAAAGAPPAAGKIDVIDPNKIANQIGLLRGDYGGSKSTLCLGCGHDQITRHIITATYE